MPRPSSATIRPLYRVVVRPIRAFLALEAASGILLLASAAAALAWVNLGDARSYRALLAAPLTLGAGPLTARFDLHALVNDGLMTVFFLVVGLEIKRELAVGELRTPARAALPAVAALGGMLVPAALYLAVNHGGPGRPGWGVPMATDIAFSIGVLTLLRRRVPNALVVFVTALAIFDDVGGILVIAFFYGGGLHAGWLAAAAAIAGALLALGRARVGLAVPYLALGALLWVALHQGGVHATLAGVALGLAVPARADPRAPLGEPLLARLERALHPWVAFGVMPAFALVNSGVDLRRLEPAQALGPVALGTAAALLVGKAVGISTFTLAAVRAGLAPLPGGASVAKLLGASTVAGIGFTVALFIASLAFPGRPDLLDEAKVGILAGSLASGLLGAALLRLTPRVDRGHAEPRRRGLEAAG